MWRPGLTDGLLASAPNLDTVNARGVGQTGAPSSDCLAGRAGGRCDPYLALIVRSGRQPAEAEFQRVHRTLQSPWPPHRCDYKGETGKCRGHTHRTAVTGPAPACEDSTRLPVGRREKHWSRPRCCHGTVTSSAWPWGFSFMSNKNHRNKPNLNKVRD